MREYNYFNRKNTIKFLIRFDSFLLLNNLIFMFWWIWYPQLWFWKKKCEHKSIRTYLHQDQNSNFLVYNNFCVFCFFFSFAFWILKQNFILKIPLHFLILEIWMHSHSVLPIEHFFILFSWLSMQFNIHGLTKKKKKWKPKSLFRVQGKQNTQIIQKWFSAINCDQLGLNE